MRTVRLPGHLDAGDWQSFIDPYSALSDLIRTSATALLKYLAKNGDTLEQGCREYDLQLLCHSALRLPRQAYREYFPAVFSTEWKFCVSTGLIGLRDTSS